MYSPDTDVELQSLDTHVKSSQGPTRVRVEFPETWLWSESSAGADGRVTMQVTAPDTITSWVASAFAVSSDVGLGVAPDAARLIVFKPFFLSLNLPYAVIRGEEFGLQITVFNYLSSELQVTVTLNKSPDFKIRHPNTVEPESVEMQKTVKVGAKDAVSVYYWIVPESLGQIPIEVSATSSAAGDAVRRQLLVKPEGTQLEYSTSVFIDLTSLRHYNTSLNIALPDEVVPGSQIVELTALGDLLGPSVNGLDKLVKMPYGCGEQNMLNFAPNIYVMKYLETAGQLTADLTDKSHRYMMAGYQRELTYQRDDGSFSAFGNSDPAGSIWLSAFVAKCFHEAKEYITVDGEKVANTINWIITHQSTDGAFQEPPDGRVCHTEMQGGASLGVPLTAYVLISLLENRNNAQVTNTNGLARAIRNAVSHLESHLSAISSDPYVLNIVTYALTLAGSSRATTALNMLNSLAITEGGTKHWEKARSSAEEARNDNRWRPPYTQSRAVDIEMTAYGLLTYSHNGDVSGAVPIAKWIIAQRNPNGGFSSTQDTVLALQALAEFASLTVAPPGDNVGLQLTATYGDESHSFSTITRRNALLLQTVQLPSTIDSVHIEASGRGTALVQLNVKYNLLTVNDDADVDLIVSTFEDNRLLRLRTCARWTKPDQPSGMVVMEVNQLTGYGAVDLNEVKRQVGTGLKRVEDADDKMILYFDELTSDQMCMTLTSEKTLPVGNIQRAPVKMYSYYDPTSVDTEFYGPPMASAQTDHCKECPQCCGLPVGGITGNTGTQSTATQLILTFSLAALLSYLLLV